MTPPEDAQGQRLAAGAPFALPAVSVCPQDKDQALSEAKDRAPTSAPASGTIMPPIFCDHGKLKVIANRSDFLKAASARRQPAGSFMLQARDRKDGYALTRVGFTASKKTGNAVVRARAKRRLREIARAILPEMGLPGWDYVLVSRPGVTTEANFESMLRDLQKAIAAVHRPRVDRPRDDKGHGAPKPAPSKPEQPEQSA